MGLFTPEVVDRILDTADSVASFRHDAERALAADCLTLEQFHFLQRVWSTEAFGPSPPRGPTGPLKHLAKEVPEALEAVAEVERLQVGGGNSVAADEARAAARERLLTELVDCYFLVGDAVWRGGFGSTELRQMLGRKLVVNRLRKLTPTAPDQAVEHDRTGERP